MDAKRRKEAPAASPELGDSMAEHPLVVRAHERLARLAVECAKQRFFGVVGIEISFEAGQPLIVRHTVQGTDKLGT
jgi:hypothetical protein